MQQVVGEGCLWEVPLTSIARRKMKKKAKESQHLFPGQQGAAEHKSDLPPPFCAGRMQWGADTSNSHTHKLIKTYRNISEIETVTWTQTVRSNKVDKLTPRCTSQISSFCGFTLFSFVLSVTVHTCLSCYHNKNALYSKKAIRHRLCDQTWHVENQIWESVIFHLFFTQYSFITCFIVFLLWSL